MRFELQRKAKDGLFYSMRSSGGPAYQFLTKDDALHHRKFWSSDAIHTNDFRVINSTTGEEV